MSKKEGSIGMRQEITEAVRVVEEMIRSSAEGVGISVGEMANRQLRFEETDKAPITKRGALVTKTRELIRSDREE